MPELQVNTFPSNEIEALAMLYVQSQELSGLSPEEILDMYQTAYDRIRIRHREKPEQRRFGWTRQ